MVYKILVVWLQQNYSVVTSMLMRRLDLDNAELNTDLAKLETAQNKAKDERNVKRLSELSKLDKEYQSQIWEEKTHIKDIDSQV